MRTVDLVQLKAWSLQLCHLDDVDPLAVVADLGVGPAPAAYLGGVGRMQPPPIGTSRCELSVVQGRFRSLTFTFRSPQIRRQDLEDALGQGMVLRRPRALADHQVAYRVVAADAVYSCDVVAWFDGPPTRLSLATRIMLRRRRSVRLAGAPPSHRLADVVQMVDDVVQEVPAQ